MHRCIATSNKCLTSSNKKLLGTSASLLVTSALLVVTRKLLGTSASLLVTSALLVVTRTLLGAPGRSTRNKKLLGACSGLHCEPVDLRGWLPPVQPLVPKSSGGSFIEVCFLWQAVGLIFVADESFLYGKKNEEGSRT